MDQDYGTMLRDADACRLAKEEERLSLEGCKNLLIQYKADALSGKLKGIKIKRGFFDDSVVKNENKIRGDRKHALIYPVCRHRDYKDRDSEWLHWGLLIGGVSLQYYWDDEQVSLNLAAKVLSIGYCWNIERCTEVISLAKDGVVGTLETDPDLGGWDEAYEATLRRIKGLS